MGSNPPPCAAAAVTNDFMSGQGLRVRRVDIDSTHGVRVRKGQSLRVPRSRRGRHRRQSAALPGGVEAAGLDDGLGRGIDLPERVRVRGRVGDPVVHQVLSTAADVLASSRRSWCSGR